METQIPFGNDNKSGDCPGDISGDCPGDISGDCLGDLTAWLKPCNSSRRKLSAVCEQYVLDAGGGEEFFRRVVRWYTPLGAETA